MSQAPADHRKLGRELELYHSDPLVGAGLPIWLPNGAAARHAIESYIREAERLAGYQHVYSPPMAKREMYRRSGHLAKFGDDMFPAMAEEGQPESEALMLRPSLCPHHAMVFGARGRSYRELPLRVAELGGMYRAERSGVVGGLGRVRAISLNDAHVFCALDQVGDEVAAILAMILDAHRALGFAADSFRLSLRGQGPAYLGSPADWDLAEDLLRQALLKAGIAFAEVPGEAAFYGPKIDIQVRDLAGREWSLSTIQVDFAQPERFDLSYVDRAGERARPVMVHRSVVGSLERLMAHLIEVHQGAFPAWYAPVQLAVAPVGPAQDAAAHGLREAAMRAGLRVELLLDGSLGNRIRLAAQRKVPYLAVLGAREVAAGEVSLRLRDGRELPARPVAEALSLINAVVAAHSPALLPA
ncbi:threonine--tRNA ligase [Catellatospora sp. TT07R-123]|uniref:threonine--tRNA ligase n=1 Tax=Catellatospora sp. TT07R-123 TaxID=2733863 RepID=UPI001B2345A8|nr:threonine--tRNA ligase [Catellatospora sp. TT07R-123]GHJ48159.1 threonine--tRNA ligase [Catellatospora sp. TT07R-123]